MNREEKDKLLGRPEYQFLYTEPDLKEGIFLLGFSGSYAYGTNVPGSDIDLRGIPIFRISRTWNASKSL